MTTNHSQTRSELVRKRRAGPVTPGPEPKLKKSYRPEHLTSRPVQKKSTKSRSASQNRGYSYATNRRHLDIAFSTSRARVQTPGITLPTLGPRTASGFLVLVLGFALISMWNSTVFQVTGVKLTGNVRLTAEQVNTVFSAIGKPVFSVVPSRIKQDLLVNFPDIETLSISLSLPNQVIVHVNERIPTILWQETDGSSWWVDANGVRFPATESLPNLVTIQAVGDPPSSIIADPGSAPASNNVFLDPMLIKTVTSMLAIAPQGTSLTYDPAYGLGWSDPRGWLVYFGETVDDITEKLAIYQAIIDKLTQEGIHPTLISVEYLDAPFYRTE